MKSAQLSWITSIIIRFMYCIVNHWTCNVKQLLWGGTGTRYIRKDYFTKNDSSTSSMSIQVNWLKWKYNLMFIGVDIVILLLKKQIIK